MNILSFFKQNKEVNYTDEEELDQLCQLLVELSKLVTTIKQNQIFNHDDEIQELLEKLTVNIETLQVTITNGYPLVPLFDFKDVKFNGYRSIFMIVKKCMQELKTCLQKLSSNVTFNRTKYKELAKDYMKFLTQLTLISKQMLQMMVVQKTDRSLFFNKHDNEDIYLSILTCYDAIQPDMFYGQVLGFYLCEPCQFLAKLFCSIQLGMGQAMSLPKSNLEVFVSTIINSAESWLLERKRGSLMADLFKQATIKFCKQFWNLVDHPIVITASRLVLPHLKIIKDITLQPVPIQLPLANNSDQSIEILPPGENNEFQTVKIRLLSRTLRDGMQWLSPGHSESTYLSSSDNLVVHIHGGGFVAQSSQSHDGYLRQWAIDLDSPIVSIDYSHAPKYPYPRAHQECLYAYAWVLKNLSQFGCSPDCKILICGDSAGGNLALGCTIKVLQLNIRAPDAVILAYPAVLVDFVPSPARFVGLFCPILPMGVLARCLLAYGGVNEENLVKHLNKDSISDKNNPDRKQPSDVFLDHGSYDSKGERIFWPKSDGISPITLLLNANLPNDPVMSPILADDSIFLRFPPLSVFGCEFDPLLDDSVELCKKAVRSGAKSVNLYVRKGLPHGFLSMASPMTKDCMRANELYVEEIKRLLQMNI